MDLLDLQTLVAEGWLGWMARIHLHAVLEELEKSETAALAFQREGQYPIQLRRDSLALGRVINHLWIRYIKNVLRHTVRPRFSGTT